MLPSAFVVMPFQKKPGPDGVEIDFELVYAQLLEPAIRAAGLQPRRADADRRSGSIHADMFQELLLAEFVVADLTLDNPNVWYELGVRHALRASGSLLTFALRDRLPFDIAGQRAVRYTLVNGKLDPEKLRDERQAITDAITATVCAPRGRRTSPVYDQLPTLQEPDWKRLRVGNVNELWLALQTWEERLQVAVGKQRPGDILVLAEETPNRVLRLEGLRSAARALVTLDRPKYALAVLEQARKIDPDDAVCRQLEALAMGQDYRFDEARVALRRLADECRDGTTLGLLARTSKHEWKRLWEETRNQEPGSGAASAARKTAAHLWRAADAYTDAFRHAPDDYRSGINALILGRLGEHVTGQPGSLDLKAIACGVRWAVESALIGRKDQAALFRRAELALVEGEAEDALRDYEGGAQYAVQERNRLMLGSRRQQLELLRELDFQPAIVEKAVAVMQRAEEHLGNLARACNAQPERIFLFAGHRVDDPCARGPGKALPARLPPERVEVAARRIRAALDEENAGAGDLGICGGSSGGDLLFAKACLERGMRLEMRLARRQAQHLRESVTCTDPDHRWQRMFDEVTGHQKTCVLVMPDELGPTPAGVDPHERCRRWKLYSALSCGLRNLSFIALWDREPNPERDSTEHMVELVRELTGREPHVIDPHQLEDKPILDDPDLYLLSA